MTLFTMATVASDTGVLFEIPYSVCYVHYLELYLK